MLKRNRENLREFFSACFQPILCRLFSFDGSSSEGWMNAAFTTGSERDVKDLLDFLSPEGSLIRAMLIADSDKLVQFAFPLDRLPELTQRMLQTESGAMALNRIVSVLIFGGAMSIPFMNGSTLHLDSEIPGTQSSSGCWSS